MTTRNLLSQRMSVLGMIFLAVTVGWGTAACDRAAEETAVTNETEAAAEQSEAAIAQAILRDASEEEETHSVLRGPYPVVRVVDAETLKVLRKGQEEGICLLGIDAPDPGQPGYQEAEKYLRSLVGREVFLSFDLGEGRDRIGFQTAIVFSSGQNVNLEMIRMGWSPYRVPIGRGVHYEPEFRQAEQQAKAEGRGIWKKGDR